MSPEVSGYNADVPTPPVNSPVERVISAIEHAAVLDTAAERISALTRRLLPPGRARDLLSGTPIGHPAHPALVMLPLGTLLSATALDLTSGRHGRRSAQRLIALGLVTAGPAAAAGASDWLDTNQAERRVGLVHWGLNTVGLTLYWRSWRARRRGRHARGVALGVAGASVLGGSGWLGGHLSYALGVGVDTTAFTHMSQDWCDLGAAATVAEVGAKMTGQAGEAQVLVVRTAQGLVALADRCTHRGGPLHEGSIAGGCVTCPWHGSSFELDGGAVTSGPATRPQPAFETREVNGRVEVRRAGEQAGLRTFPV